jgi:hypothetical protein
VFAFLTRLLLPWEKCFIDLNLNELARGTTVIQRTIVPYWNNAVGLGSIICHTKSKKKMMETATDLSMTNLLSTRGSHQAGWL